MNKSKSRIFIFVLLLFPFTGLLEASRKSPRKNLQVLGKRPDGVVGMQRRTSATNNTSQGGNNVNNGGNNNVNQNNGNNGGNQSRQQRRQRRRTSLFGDDSDDDDLKEAMYKTVFGKRYFNLKIGDLIAQLVWTYLLHENGGNLLGGLGDGDGARRPSFTTILLKMFQWATATTFLGGFGNALQIKVEEIVKKVIDGGVDVFGDLTDHIKRKIFNNGSEKLTNKIIVAWIREMKDIPKKIKEVAKKSDRSDDCGQRLRMRQFQNIGEEGKAEEVTKIVEEEDRSWEENKSIFLRRILNVADDAQHYALYYKNVKSKRRIYKTIQLFIASLIGEGIVKDESGVAMPDGGLYHVIKKTKTVSDFTSPEVAAELGAYEANILGVLDFLKSLVSIDKNNGKKRLSESLKSSRTSLSLSD